MKRIQLFLFLIYTGLSLTLQAQTYTTWTQSSILKYPLNGVGQPTGIGRVTHFAFHPTDSKVMFATSASGGLWKTSTEGEYWYNLNTDFFPWTTKMSCIVVDHTNPDILYIGTGDTDYQSWWAGRGVWKSTNGGSTWSQTSNIISSKLVNRMIMSKTSNTTLLAAVYDGIYKSTDAGATWTRTLNSSPMRDVVMKPVAGGSNTVYACSETSFWVSNNFGDTWAQITSGLTPIDAASSFNSLRIGVSQANSNIVYVLAHTNGNRTYAGIYRSSDSGLNFTRMSIASDPPSVAQPNILSYPTDGAESGGQGGYNMCITVHPDNADIVYIGSHSIWKSTNGGASWQNRSCWYCGDATGLHTDIHYLIFSPYYTSPRRLYVAMDGGMARTFDNNDNYWEACSDGLAATEYGSYGNSHLYKELYLGGTQDNGLQMYWNQEITTIGGGDYYEDFEFDEFDEEFMYADKRYTKYTFDMVGGKTDEGNWATKDNLGNDLTTPTDNIGNSPSYFTSGANTNYLFAYRNKVWICKNLKAASPVWTEIAITNGSNNEYLHGAASPVSVDLAYVVRRDNMIYRCTNASAASPAFTALTFPAGASSNDEAYVEPHRTNSNIVWISLNSRIYRSDNQGGTFTQITGLPNLSIKKIIHDRYSANNGIYVANAAGVYYTDDSMGGTWILFSRGMPTIADITDMDMYNDGTSKSVLRVSTYGRGIWQAELYKSTVTPPAADFMIYNTQQTIGGNGSPQNPCNNYYLLTDKSTGQPTSWSWSFNPSAGITFVNQTSATSRNPMIQVTTAGAYAITLTVTNAQGSNSKTDTLRFFKLSVPPACTPIVTGTYGGWGYGLGISRVQFSDINHSTPLSVAYMDYTCSQTAIVTEGSSYPLTVDGGWSNFGDRVVVWIDYNNNGNFNDAGELIYNDPTPGFTDIFTRTVNITIPTGAAVVKNIPLRMRVNGYDTWKAKTSNTCINNVYNEVEDYAVMVIPAAPLPVEIVSFYATIESPVVRLDWITAHETNLSHFIIQKTTDQMTGWEEVDRVLAKGGSSFTNYLAYDNRPGTGIIYYRIKAIDKEGRDDYTKIIKVDMDGKYQYSIYPNPGTDLVHVVSNTNVAVNDYNRLIIRNLAGQEVKRIDMYQEAVSFSIKELEPGIYMMEIYSEDKVFYEKLVKQ